MSSKICENIHIRLNNLPRYSFPIDKTNMSENGIYILFEKSEFAHGVDRIVRIGTHRGNNNLYKRLKEHFINENKDRSIFRKNIGRAILNKNNDVYLNVWDLELVSKKSLEHYKEVYDENYQKNIEKKVTEYINNNFSFAVIEVNDVKERLFYESRLISTISNCNGCKPSNDWLGKFSPKDKIKESGLWLVNELYKQSFSKEEYEYFVNKYIIQGGE